MPGRSGYGVGHLPLRDGRAGDGVLACDGACYTLDHSGYRGRHAASPAQTPARRPYYGARLPPAACKQARGTREDGRRHILRLATATWLSV